MSIRRWIGTVVAAAALLAPAAATAAREAEDPAQTPLARTSAIVQPSIAFVRTTFTAQIADTSDNTLLRTEPFSVEFPCTGFFVNPDGWVGTAGHCVAYDADVRAALVDAAAAWLHEQLGGEYSEEAVLEYARRNFAPRGERTVVIKVSWGVAAAGIGEPRTLPARLEGFKRFDRGDVALLKIDATNLPSLRLDGDATVDVGEEIISVGFPGSVDDVTDATKFDPSFKDGTVSSVKTRGEGLIRVYEISAAVSGGMSGGPTVNVRGDVIGINSFGITGETQPFNFASPASELLGLMRAEGVRNEIGAPNALYRAGLEAYWAGNKDDALTSFDRAIELLPSFEAAQTYRAYAAALPDEEEAPFPWLLLGVGIGSVLVLGALLATLVFVVARRHARRDGPATAPDLVIEAPAEDRSSSIGEAA